MVFRKAKEVMNGVLRSAHDLLVMFGIDARRQSAPSGDYPPTFATSKLCVSRSNNLRRAIFRLESRTLAWKKSSGTAAQRRGITFIKTC